ncbi:hypothetical protein CHS0354_043105 [Potamilus streckersoni]|uniref:Bleomycin hydrolase n=1 Tax=Potamilus streckersoni TaxID=2493646 RepID=A0AAE0RMK0_9BIVA|nr:hypothetical protein CHS0354_043105 [Potamilus streckersoni]
MSLSVPSNAGVPHSTLAKYREKFLSSSKNLLAQNGCTTQNLLDMCKSRNSIQAINHTFDLKIENEGKPITDQKFSGRCWIFACLNIMRVPFMKQYKMEEFEFSQAYLFYWDKIERANYLLDSFIDCARKGETYEGRLIHHLLKNPLEDGGQWDMLVNLIEKYGVMPKACFPESWCAENSNRLGRLLNNRLREFCMQLCQLVEKGTGEVEIQSEKTVMMEEVYRIMNIVLGTPPEKFTFEYTDTDKKYQSFKDLSPLQFYKDYIKGVIFDTEEYVCVVNDPRPQNSYNKLYTVEYLGNMSGGRKVLYINQPVDVLKQLTIKCISENKPVWFGCDVGKSFCSKEGLLDLKCLDFTLVFDVDPLKMNKSERLMYGESLMTHAMVFTGVGTEQDGNPGHVKATKWRVENSWGDKDGSKGYILMTDEWFTEFVYEVVVPKSLLSEDMQRILDQEPVVLPAWDPMGALA